MKGKFARVAAISPRPEGTYRLAVRMRASTPMAVTIEALGAWGAYDVTTSWERYELLIAEPDGDYIDLYPLSNDTLYVEDMQLTYGKDAHEWRPAPEDDVAYDWTCVTMDDATIANIRDIESYKEYYCLVDADDPAPSAPTTYPPPSPWSATEEIDEAYQAVVRVTGSITGATVSAAVFAHAMGEAGGVYRFTYDGAAWKYDGSTVVLHDYGVLVTGTPAAGDTIAITLQINTGVVMYRCAVTLYSDGSYDWGDVTPAGAFNAARAAMNTSTRYQTQVQQMLDSWDVSVRAAVIQENVDDDGNRTTTTVSDMLGRIQVTESTVTSLIDEVHQNEDGLSERITSLQTQTDENILNTFTRATKYADEQYGDTKEYVVTAQSWQRFSEDGIEQGKLGSPFKSKLTNTELGFYENDQKVAYINNNRLKITHGEIIDSLIIGNFEFVSGDNGLGLIFNGSWGET